jgi:hypothetical protein
MESEDIVAIEMNSGQQGATHPSEARSALLLSWYNLGMASQFTYTACETKLIDRAMATVSPT